MKLILKTVVLFTIFVAVFASAQTFKHIVIVFQENRTPDNLFGSNPTFATGVDIIGTGSRALCKDPTPQGYSWIDLTPISGLVSCYDLNHTHQAWVNMCDLDPSTQTCKMDAACAVGVAPGMPKNCTPPSCPDKAYGYCPEYQYVGNSDLAVKPYFDIASLYGFANYFFATNQGPSFPAHQFILSGTSAPVLPTDNYHDWFAAENQSSGHVLGCIAPSNVKVEGIDPQGHESFSWYNSAYPCYHHQTLSDLLDSHQPKISWKYYAPYEGSLWTAPNAIDTMCLSSGYGGHCTNPDNWGIGKNVSLEVTALAPIFSDIQNCNLPAVSWVIPDGRWSDHAGQGQATSNNGLGPAYVAAIVNAIGNSWRDSAGGGVCDYWGYGNNSGDKAAATLILIAWDDWGGWYDHVAPPIARNQYEVGFRVPLLVVSAYTTQGYVSGPIVGDGSSCPDPKFCMDFGSILRYVEDNFLGGARIGGTNAHYADYLAQQLDPGFVNGSGRGFAQIALPAMYSTYTPTWFMNQTGTPEDPDEDANEPSN